MDSIIRQLLKPGEEKRKSTFGATETGPWVVLELLRELVNEVGVNQADISVGDPMTDICGHNYEVWFAEFPDVVYTGKFGAIHGRTLVNPTEKDLLFYSDKTKSDKLYDVIENADYLINVANLKPHMSAGYFPHCKKSFWVAGKNECRSSALCSDDPSWGKYFKLRISQIPCSCRSYGQQIPWTKHCSIPR